MVSCQATSGLNHGADLLVKFLLVLGPVALQGGGFGAVVGLVYPHQAVGAFVHVVPQRDHYELRVTCSLHYVPVTS